MFEFTVMETLKILKTILPFSNTASLINVILIVKEYLRELSN